LLRPRLAFPLMAEPDFTLRDVQTLLNQMDVLPPEPFGGPSAPGPSCPAQAPPVQAAPAAIPMETVPTAEGLQQLGNDPFPNIREKVFGNLRVLEDLCVHGEAWKLGGSPTGASSPTHVRRRC
jgi:hypothetical protein